LTAEGIARTARSMATQVSPSGPRLVCQVRGRG
jgi:hypothetical protein